MNPPPRSLRQRLESLPAWALIVLCLVYVVSPIDLIPFCPVDDAGVVAWTAWTLLKRLVPSSAKPAASAA